MPLRTCAHVGSAAAVPLTAYSCTAPADRAAAAQVDRDTRLRGSRSRIPRVKGWREYQFSSLQQFGVNRQLRWRCAAAVSSAAITLRHPDGRTVPLDQDIFTVGSGDESDLRVARNNVQPQHAQLERKGGRLFCVALAGDADELLSDTHTWLNGSQLRHGVSYLVAPGSQLAFGSEDQQYTLQFEEEGSANPMMEMLMKGMVNQGSEEVRKQMENL